MFVNEFVLFEKLGKMTTRQWCFAAGAFVVMAALLVYLAKKPQKSGKTDVRALTYGALCMAMSFVLSYIKLWSMPLGGSVTLASMLPLLWYSNKFGVKNGLIAGAAYGLLQLIQKPEIYHWVQVILDYPLAFAMLGLAGSVKQLSFVRMLTTAAWMPGNAALSASSAVTRTFSVRRRISAPLTASSLNSCRPALPYSRPAAVA